MKLLIAGGTGLIGSELIALLKQDKSNEIHVLSRQNVNDNYYTGIIFHRLQSLDTIKIDEDFDVVINLAGASIANQRWTKEYKQTLIFSRVLYTQSLVAWINSCEKKPAVLVNASAVGYYGDRGEELLTEDSSKGSGFLSDLCANWEKAALRCQCRTVVLRTGIVLSSKGGALPQMLLPYKFRIAPCIGGGNQYFPWISAYDAVRAICFLINNKNISGAVNLTAPNPLTYKELNNALAKKYKSWLKINVPIGIIKMALGERATLFSSSQRVYPKKLIESAFNFEHSEIFQAI